MHIAKHRTSAFVTHTNTPPLTLAIGTPLDGDTCRHCSSSTCARREFRPRLEAFPVILRALLQSHHHHHPPHTAGPGRPPGSTATPARAQPSPGGRGPAARTAPRPRPAATPGQRRPQPGAPRGSAEPVPAAPSAATFRRGGTGRDGRRGTPPGRRGGGRRAANSPEPSLPRTGLASRKAPANRQGAGHVGSGRCSAPAPSAPSRRPAVPTEEKRGEPHGGGAPRTPGEPRAEVRRCEGSSTAQSSVPRRAGPPPPRAAVHSALPQHLCGAARPAAAAAPA